MHGYEGAVRSANALTIIQCTESFAIEITVLGTSLVV